MASVLGRASGWLIVATTIWLLRRAMWGPWWSDMQPKKEQPQSPAYYLELDLLPTIRDFMLDAVRRSPIAGPIKREAERLLMTATRVDLPLPKEKLEWDEIEAEAERRGPEWTVIDVMEEWTGKRQAES